MKMTVSNLALLRAASVAPSAITIISQNKGTRSFKQTRYFKQTPTRSYMVTKSRVDKGHLVVYAYRRDMSKIELRSLWSCDQFFMYNPLKDELT